MAIHPTKKNRPWRPEEARTSEQFSNRFPYQLSLIPTDLQAAVLLLFHQLLFPPVIGSVPLLNQYQLHKWALPCCQVPPVSMFIPQLFEGKHFTFLSFRIYASQYDVCMCYVHVCLNLISSGCFCVQVLSQSPSWYLNAEKVKTHFRKAMFLPWRPFLQQKRTKRWADWSHVSLSVRQPELCWLEIQLFLALEEWRLDRAPQPPVRAGLGLLSRVCDWLWTARVTVTNNNNNNYHRCCEMLF